MTLNEKIIYCRKKAGMSQEGLAEVIGVSRQAISKWETGRAYPDVQVFPVLADIFGVSIDYIMRGEGYES